MTWTALGVAAVVALSAAVQSVSGFGFALLAVPLLSFLIDPKTAVVLTVAIASPLTFAIALGDRHHVLGRVVAAMMAPAIVGIPLGLWILGRVDGRVLEGSIAVVVIALTGLLALGFSTSDKAGVDLVAGFVSGVLSTSTGTNGPPLVFALHAKGVTPAEFRGTLSVAFILEGLVGLIGFAVAGRMDAEVGRLFLIALPGLFGGWLFGAGLGKRIDPQRFRALVLCLLVGTAASSLVAAIFG